MRPFSKSKKKIALKERIFHGSKIRRCAVCEKQFKPRSHFDALCNLCWADNEMRPYIDFPVTQKIKYASEEDPIAVDG